MFGEKLAVPHSGTLTRATLQAEFIALEAGKRLFWSKSMKKQVGAWIDFDFQNVAWAWRYGEGSRVAGGTLSPTAFLKVF